jgi:streptogramin lyase
MSIGSDPRPGSELAGFRLEALLGRGGMGAVYRAEDLRLGRKVALKLLAPELAENDRFRERFLRESQLAASLDHPHIVPIYAAGETDGQLYLAMRYVEGYDLRALLAREGRLEPGRALALLEQVADALDAAHERGLIHRDVKPGNVLIAERAGREHCYLADFGLTKQTASISGLTGTGELVGTVAYVSPEQIRGEAVDGRADVYALGCVLYECLAGQSPFARETEVATLWAHVHDPPPALGAARPELGGEIDAVLGRALDKTPAERPGTCGELVASARAALGLSGPAAPTPTGGERGRRVRLRGRRLGLLLGGTAVAMAAIVAAGLLLRGENAPVTVPPNSVALIDPDTNRVVDTIATGPAPGAVAVGAGVAWVANVDERTLSRIDTRTHAERRVALDATPTDVAVGFDAVWVALGVIGDLARIDARRNVAVERVDLARRPERGSVAVDLDRGFVWAAYADSTVARVDPATNRVDWRGFAGAPVAIAVGGDAAWLANQSLASVTRLEAETGAEVKAIQVPKGPVDVAVGGGFVWVASETDDVVTRIDPVDSSAINIPVGDGPTAVAFGAGAAWVANRGDGTVDRIDPTTRDVTVIDIGNAPVGIAVGAGSVWVTVQSR